MIVLKDKQQCCGCAACVQVCPPKCISMQPDEEGFLYPQIDQAACIECGLCEKVCPMLQSPAEDTNNQPKAYAAYNKDETIRLQSSSGGVFTLLALHTLQNGGVVFGAALSADCKSVHHTMVSNEADLAKLRGSKYLQSEIGVCYQQAQAFLRDGKPVLFSGTPCEIEGLKTFLRQDYDNLTCVDLICHGSPSPKLWGKYVEYRADQKKNIVESVTFRDKRNSWKNYEVCMSLTEGAEYRKPFYDETFMQMFLQDLCLRPSCYSCPFKKKNRVSDITLADFWGSGRVCPDMDDDKGLSLVIIHSLKGASLLEKVKNEMELREVPLEEALEGNPSMTRSCIKPDKRDEFMRNMSGMSILSLKIKYLKKRSLNSYIKGAIKKIMRLRVSAKK